MSEACPSCGSSLLPDQRYCLSCGQRRGEPRLPIMDAVTYMNASRRPQPAAAAAAPPPQPSPRRRPSISASSSLVGVVATLVLAIGVGVMIGRSGEGRTGNTAAPQVIRVGGTAGPAATASTAGGSAGGAVKGGNQPKSATMKTAKEKAATGRSGASKATEEVFEPAPGVKIAPPEQQLGGDCDPSVAGCGDSGKFEGDFFE